MYASTTYAHIDRYVCVPRVESTMTLEKYSNLISLKKWLGFSCVCLLWRVNIENFVTSSPSKATLFRITETWIKNGALSYGLAINELSKLFLSPHPPPVSNILRHFLHTERLRRQFEGKTVHTANWTEGFIHSCAFDRLLHRYKYI
jgi:hypothetical protein